MSPLPPDVRAVLARLGRVFDSANAARQSFDVRYGLGQAEAEMPRLNVTLTDVPTPEADNETH